MFENLSGIKNNIRYVCERIIENFFPSFLQNIKTRELCIISVDNGAMCGAQNKLMRKNIIKLQIKNCVNKTKTF